MASGRLENRRSAEVTDSEAAGGDEMNDRDCDNCAHHSDGGCSVWECSFEAKEDDTISRT